MKLKMSNFSREGREENVLQDDYAASQPQPFTLNCKELVWALAFGSSLSETRPHSTSRSGWWRYKVGKHLVLATGLQSGRIRTWDVLTGKLICPQSSYPPSSNLCLLSIVVLTIIKLMFTLHCCTHSP